MFDSERMNYSIIHDIKKRSIQIDFDKSQLKNPDALSTLELQQISRYIFRKARTTKSLHFMKKLKIRISGNTRIPGVCFILTDRALRILQLKKILWSQTATRKNEEYFVKTLNQSWLVFRTRYTFYNHNFCPVPFSVRSDK